MDELISLKLSNEKLDEDSKKICIKTIKSVCNIIIQYVNDNENILNDIINIFIDRIGYSYLHFLRRNNLYFENNNLYSYIEYQEIFNVSDHYVKKFIISENNNIINHHHENAPTTALFYILFEYFKYIKIKDHTKLKDICAENNTYLSIICSDIRNEIQKYLNFAQPSTKINLI